MNNKHYELTPLKYLNSEDYKIAMKWAIKSFTVEIDTSNEFDNEALIVYKKDKGKKYKCGYIRKYDYVYTEIANELYMERRFILENNDWVETEETQELKNNEHWGKTEKVAIHSKEELDYLLNNFEKYKLLTERSTKEWSLYLELKNEK